MYKNTSSTLWQQILTFNEIGDSLAKYKLSEVTPQKVKNVNRQNTIKTGLKKSLKVGCWKRHEHQRGAEGRCLSSKFIEVLCWEHYHSCCKLCTDSHIIFRRASIHGIYPSQIEKHMPSRRAQTLNNKSEKNVHSEDLVHIFAFLLSPLWIRKSLVLFTR